MGKICIIVPVYNTESFLERCIESILRQTYTNYELILVDDGSMDKSGEICDKYEKEDCRIHVLHQENRGQSAARNAGLEYMFSYIDCEYIGFVDSDDWIHPQMYEILCIIMDKYKANMSVCSYMNIKGDEKTFEDDLLEKAIQNSKIIDKKKALEGLFLAGNDMYGLVMPKLYRRELFKKRRFEEGIIYEDVKSCYKVLYDAISIAVTDCKLYYYYQNPFGTTKSQYSKKRLDIMDAMEEQIRFFEEHNYMDIYALAVRRYLYLLSYHGKLAHDSLQDPEVDEKIKKRLKELFLKERKRCDIIPSNSPDCYNTLFPKIMRWYWRAYGIKEKIRHDT